jgi:hypothetical protein
MNFGENLPFCSTLFHKKCIFAKSLALFILSIWWGVYQIKKGKYMREVSKKLFTFASSYLKASHSNAKRYKVQKYVPLPNHYPVFQ